MQETWTVEDSFNLDYEIVAARTWHHPLPAADVRFARLLQDGRPVAAHRELPDTVRQIGQQLLAEGAQPAQVARKLGVTDSTVSRWLDELRNPRPRKPRKRSGQLSFEDVA
jgi:Homeodomain-like domain-containing protein